jgi:hypothetical protein
MQRRMLTRRAARFWAEPMIAAASALPSAPPTAPAAVPA